MKFHNANFYMRGALRGGPRIYVRIYIYTNTVYMYVRTCTCRLRYLPGAACGGGTYEYRTDGASGAIKASCKTARK